MEENPKVGTKYLTRSGQVVKITHYDYVSETHLWLGKFEDKSSSFFLRKTRHGVWREKGRRLPILLNKEHEEDLIHKI